MTIQLAHPTPPRAQGEAGLSGHGGLLMHIASTAHRRVCPQPRANTRPGEGSGPFPLPSAEGKGPGAHVLSSMHLPRPPALIDLPCLTLASLLYCEKGVTPTRAVRGPGPKESRPSSLGSGGHQAEPSAASGFS